MRVAERRASLRARGADRRGEIRRFRHEAHALAAAARDRFDEDRVTDLAGDSRDVLVGRRGAQRAGDLQVEKKERAPRLNCQAVLEWCFRREAGASFAPDGSMAKQGYFVRGRAV